MEKVFGPQFASAVLQSPVGAWSGPLASPYGAHLVWIESHEPGAVPAFELVRAQVLERWLDEQRTTRVVHLLRDLKGRYPLEVESAAWRERGNT